MGDNQIILWLFGQIVVGAAIWGGIRSDIRAMHHRIELSEKSVGEAHTRIDRILENHK